MNPEVILLISAAALIVLTLVFRVTAIAIFLTLIAGALVSKLVASDMTQIVNSIIALNAPMSSIVQIFLLVIAPLVLILGLRGSVKGAGVVWQVIPAVAAGILLVYFVPPMLPYDTQKAILDSNLYGYVSPYFGLAAAAGLLASVLQLWALKPKHHDKHDKKHKK